MILDGLIDERAKAGDRIELRERCDHRLETSSARFGNAINFQGELYLLGNDMLTRYPTQP